ncbi:hypothetical protein [Rouxiella chamberiensis]|uniref:Uncharacterized protein n=1 Tax=Rouxiella chamberiensis TaxID=1513468 RepID=A0ABY7HM36_9GAMM|nr:hypothetical protein [Rouxiella chamberiensis]WAS99980.1 hypothetical protein O1V66_13175 [Rouxiella chamberiensis]
MIRESGKNVFAYNLSFLALLCAFSIDLFTYGYPGKLFYLVSYVAIFYTFVYFYQNRRALNLDKPALYFFITLLLVGLSRLVWSWHFKQTHYEDIRDNYALGGKRFVIAAFLLFYFYQYRALLLRSVLKLGIGVMFIGMAISLWYGHVTPEPLTHRAQWTSDAATTGAYLVVIYAMATIVAVRACYKDSGFSILLFSLVFLLTMGMILMTETRSAILLTPLIFAAFFIYYYRSVSLKIQLALALVIVLAASSVVYFSWNRISQIGSDIAEYNTNNATSIGARFSMWGPEYTASRLTCWVKPWIAVMPRHWIISIIRNVRTRRPRATLPIICTMICSIRSPCRVFSALFRWRCSLLRASIFLCAEMRCRIMGPSLFCCRYLFSVWLTRY